MISDRRLIRVAGVLGAIVLSSGCGGEGGAGDSGVPSSTTTTAAEAAQGPPAGDAAATTTSLASPAAVPLLEGVPLLQVVTPTAAVGIRPVLEWKPVEGAETYRAVVLDAGGNIAWVWSGGEAAVPYGGAEFPLDRGDGPIVTVGSTWSVVALDSQREVLAISERRGLEP